MREVENKIPNTSSLETAIVLNAKISEADIKILNHDKYITTAEFIKLTAENFRAKLTQGDLVSKNDLVEKLTSF